MQTEVIGSIISAVEPSSGINLMKFLIELSSDLQDLWWLLILVIVFAACVAAMIFFCKETHKVGNLVCYKLDVRIAGYCNKRDITYTRYADDLIFSCDNRDLLRNIYGTIKKIVEDEGFKINEKKTRFLTPKVRKEIIGVTVNEGTIKAPKEMKRMIRAMIHYAIECGDYSNNDKIRGYVAYIDSIEKKYKNKVIKYIEKYLTDTVTMFPELVEKFNQNKLYKELPDMEKHDISYFVDYADKANYYSAVVYERERFLARHGKVLLSGFEMHT